MCEAEKKKRKPDDDPQAPSKRRRGELSQEAKKEIDQLITKMIARDIEPFSVVDRRGFRELLEFFVPEYTPPDRTHISRDLMPQLYENVKNKVQDELNADLQTGFNCIAFTTDGWTSDTGHCYLSLTAHYITSAFVMKNFTLGLKHHDAKHTAALLCEALESMLSDWGLSDLTDVPKFFVTDNARNITSAITFGGWKSIYCFPHTLNLALQDTREATPDLKALLTKVWIPDHRIRNFFNKYNNLSDFTLFSIGA